MLQTVNATTCPQRLMTPPLADAALLAAGANPYGAISPKELELGPAWLDLHGAVNTVALSRARWVTQALGPCLGLQEGALLFVTADPYSIGAVVISIAAQLKSDGAADLLIGVLKGEDVLHRLEDFFPASPELRAERREPVRATAVAPPAALRGAIEAGAKIVIGQSVGAGAIEAAVGTGPTANELGEVRLQFVRGYEAIVYFEDNRPIEFLGELLASKLPEGSAANLSEAAEGKILHLVAQDRSAFRIACRRSNLLLDGLPTRIGDLSRHVYEEWTIEAPADQLMFGYDLLPAGEWAKGPSSRR